MRARACVRACACACARACACVCVRLREQALHEQRARRQGQWLERDGASRLRHRRLHLARQRLLPARARRLEAGRRLRREPELRRRSSGAGLAHWRARLDSRVEWRPRLPFELQPAVGPPRQHRLRGTWRGSCTRCRRGGGRALGWRAMRLCVGDAITLRALAGSNSSPRRPHSARSVASGLRRGERRHRWNMLSRHLWGRAWSRGRRSRRPPPGVRAPARGALPVDSAV